MKDRIILGALASIMIAGSAARADGEDQRRDQTIIYGKLTEQIANSQGLNLEVLKQKYQVQPQQELWYKYDQSSPILDIGVFDQDAFAQAAIDHGGN